MNILLWRAWAPIYSYPAIFSCLEKHSIGGTCSQLLWHAKGLVAMGHKVQVLGVATLDVHEEGVDFIGAINKAEQQKVLGSDHINRPDVIFLEGGYASASELRALYPEAFIVHVGQNIDRAGAVKALRIKGMVDLFAFVSPGSLSYYCMHVPSLMHKFVLLRNVVPWEGLYKDLVLGPVENKVVWVGAWTKKGLRAWAQTMERIMVEFPTLRWELYGPSHGYNLGHGVPSYIFAGLNLPWERISIADYPMPRLAKTIATAKVVLVSLGNETACISALDAHASARPVLSGNDMIFKFNNPEGSGIRAFRSDERHQALSYLLNNPDVCDKMGKAGRAFIAAERTEINQFNDLTMILMYAETHRDRAFPRGFQPPGKTEESLSYLRDRIQRLWNRSRSI